VPTAVATSDDGASRITVSWQPSDDPETGVTSYKVFRGGTQIGTSSTTSLVDVGRTPGVAYSYRVSAVNGVGLGSTASTPPVNQTIAIDTRPPSTPSGVVATDNGISQITLSWAAATDAQSGVASVACIGNRVYTGLGDDEMYFTIPGKALPRVLEQVDVMMTANAALEAFHRERAAALAR